MLIDVFTPTKCEFAVVSNCSRKVPNILKHNVIRVKCSRSPLYTSDVSLMERKKEIVRCIYFPHKSIMIDILDFHALVVNGKDICNYILHKINTCRSVATLKQKLCCCTHYIRQLLFRIWRVNSMKMTQLSVDWHGQLIWRSTLLLKGYVFVSVTI